MGGKNQNKKEKNQGSQFFHPNKLDSKVKKLQFFNDSLILKYTEL